MRLTENGADADVDDRHATTPLLWVLRDVLGMHGTKFGSGAGYCAVCTVLIDGSNEKSCQTPAKRAVGKQVTTVEGVSGPVVDAVRDAWYRTNVVQCGYYQPGQTLAAMALLEGDREPDDLTITKAVLRRDPPHQRLRRHARQPTACAQTATRPAGVPRP